MNRLIHWLCNYPKPLYDSMEQAYWIMEHYGIDALGLWDKIRYYILEGKWIGKNGIRK
jgi:hypothetical protein